MKTSNRTLAPLASISAATLMLVAGCTSEVGDPGATGANEIASACAPAVPAGLAVPAGNELAFTYDAIGVQIYGCDASATGYGWVLRAPEANLYGKRSKLAGTHYAGPTWESNDGSTVVASKLAEHAANPTAIPWLLLGATGHSGRGRMSDVTYLHRLDTAGGKAPATGCDATHAGATVRVDYVATYAFYEARRKR